ncbi:sugar ABC transporter permease [Vagococcus sp. DIV0080]|uniref:Sugar ABC transporter permease n=1 Tax=Candidatus Vagococcus giribetii TaxID=2230876 RepID=A0ABS3HQX7_9ENTE|nr:sugar ABC transporter permease [Vagococcus sp. DIV0080]MBO0476146.1 sugar ABC transporter permease [Vagococcus sp. DIV0080]
MRKKWTDYLLVMPALLLSICIVIVPGILTIVMSFTDYNGISFDVNFVGLQNFQELFSNRVFWKAISNNMIWMALFLTVPVLLALGVSVILLKKKKSKNIYQVIFLIPYVLAPAVNAMLWQNIIFNSRTGIIGVLNNIGYAVGSPLTNIQTAIYAVASVDIWHYWGYLAVIYFASLRQTPQDLVEASKIDGCNAWGTFKNVYFPHLLPTFKLMMIMIVIGSFLAFDYIKLLTGGGPANSTEVLGTYAYTLAFSTMQVGKASAVGLFMSFFGLIASTIYTILSRNEERM